MKCVVIPFILDVRFKVCGRTSSRGHTGEMEHRISPPSFCGACLNFSREKDYPFLSLVDREVVFFLHLLMGIFVFLYLYLFSEETPSSCDDIDIRTHVPTSDGFEVIN